MLSAGFALCFLCHTDTPFASEGASTAATNFRYHGKHTASIAGARGSTGTNIDAPGVGQGNALCAECPFRLHGTTANLNGTQTIDGSRLVDFSRNVTTSGTVRRWTRGATAGTGSCTITCHGANHND